MELQMNYDLSKIRIKCAEIRGAKWTRLAENEADPKHWQLGFTHSDKQAGRHSLSAGTPWQVDFIVADKPDDSLPHMVCDDVPNYPESADAALELVAWMAKPENGEWWPDASHNYPDREWSFALTYGTDVCHGVADTFPLAVCLAFMKANNIDPETL